MKDLLFRQHENNNKNEQSDGSKCDYHGGILGLIRYAFSSNIILRENCKIETKFKQIVNATFFAMPTIQHVTF